MKWPRATLPINSRSTQRQICKWHLISYKSLTYSSYNKMTVTVFDDPLLNVHIPK